MHILLFTYSLYSNKIYINNKTFIAYKSPILNSVHSMTIYTAQFSPYKPYSRLVFASHGLRTQGKFQSLGPHACVISHGLNSQPMWLHTTRRTPMWPCFQNSELHDLDTHPCISLCASHDVTHACFTYLCDPNSQIVSYIV